MNQGKGTRCHARTVLRRRYGVDTRVSKKGNPEIQAMATVWRGEGSNCKLQVMSCGEKAIAISGVKNKTPSKRSRHKSDKWESNKESIKTGSPRKQRWLPMNSHINKRGRAWNRKTRGWSEEIADLMKRKRREEVRLSKLTRDSSVKQQLSESGKTCTMIFTRSTQSSR